MGQGTAAYFANRAPLTGTGSRNRFRLGQSKIGTLLTACFAAIVLLMIVGDVIAVLQLDRVETRAWRFYQADQKSLAIMHVYLDVVTFRDTLTGLVHDQNADEFASRATALRDNFLRDVTHAQRTLSPSPHVSQDPTILIRLETVRAALPSQVDTLLELVKTGDWQAVRFRLAEQLPPLIGLSSSLVADVEQEVSQERARALESVQRTRHQLYLVLPITALVILLMAAGLGWYATRRIGGPLAQLDAGAQALARGEFGYQVELKGNDELAGLAGAFNFAAQQLQKFYDDIKRSEAYLAESNAKLEEAQRIAHVGYWEWDLTSNRVIWSDETYRIYGLSPQEYPLDIAGVRKMIHPEDLELVFRVAGDAVRGGLRTDVEHRIIRPSGELRTVHSKSDLKKDASGRPTLMFGTVQDITDRKRAEETVALMSRDLQESKTRLEEAQSIAHVGYWIFDLGNDELIWSDETYRIFGLRPQERRMNLAAFEEMIHPEDRESLHRAAQEVRGGGRPDEELRIVRPTGEVRIIHIPGTVNRNVSGQPRQTFGIVQDVTERKRAEEELRRSQFYLTEGQRLAHMGSWAFNPSGSFEYWSQELFEIYGLDPQKGAPRLEQYLATIHAQDRDFIRSLIKKMVAEALGCDVTNRIVRPDGEIRYIRCVGVPVVEDDTLQRIIGTAIDVTEHELLTQELLRREAYLAEAQLLSQTGSFGWRPDSGELVWSDETYRIFEYDHTVKPTIDLVVQRVHPDDRPDFLKVIESASAGATQFEHTYRLLLPDGSVRYVHALAHALQDASGNREFVGAATDVTSIKRAEEELRKSEAYLAEAQRLSQTGSWAWSPDQDIRYWSEECYRVLSFDPQDGLPRFDDFLQRLHPDDQPGFKQLIQTAIREKAEWEADYRIVHPDGPVRDIHVVGHPVLSSSGHLVEFVGTVMDVTERRRAEQERARLRQVEADLAHTNRVSTLGEIAASLAHEIKQPIAAAITSANTCIEWLAHDPPNLDRARAAAARIDKYGNRAAEIIDRIRSFYKKSSPQRELVDVNGIVQEMITLLKGEAHRYPIVMRAELTTELPKILVDRVQLQQVFMNLMLNAIEAMKDSGGEITVKSELQGGQLQFSVSDTGVGLPREGADQIFSAFFTTKPQGSGMGLAISRSIVESHGGRLWATANEGRGAAFHFTLPIQVTESSPLVA